jgi:hypothetical protein
MPNDEQPERREIPEATTGLLAKVRVLSALLKDVSNAGVAVFIIVLLLPVMVGWLSGWIPFPLLDALTGYNAAMKEYNRTYSEALEEVRAVTKRMQQEHAELIWQLKQCENAARR